MSFIIIYTAMQRNRSSGPQRPLDPWESVVVVFVTIVLVIAAVIGGIFGWRAYRSYTAQVTAFHQQWDAGQGHPPANKITAGKTATVMANVGSANEIWRTCTRKTCWHKDFSHCPVVVPLSKLQLHDNCYVDKSDVQVDSVMVSATRPGVYSVELRANGKSIQICLTGERNDKDKLIVWSDSSNAER